MYLILTTSSVEYAQAWSAAIYALSRPVRDPDDVTVYRYGWLTHEDGRVALSLGDDDALIHPDADVDAFVAGIPAPQPERDAARDALNAAKGSRLPFAESLPPTIAANLRTQEQMESDGWFPE